MRERLRASAASSRSGRAQGEGALAPPPLLLVALAGGLLPGVGVEAVAVEPARRVLTIDPEAGLLGGPLDREAERNCLPPARVVVGVHLDVVVRERLPTGPHLDHGPARVGEL